MQGKGAHEEFSAGQAIEEQLGDAGRYLLFRLGEELYGCDLVQIKEVLKIGVIKPVPYMVPYFLGVINLRGKIIGVVDLTKKLGMHPADENRLILIVEGHYGPLGVVVDEVQSVESISPDRIEVGVSVDSKIAPHFFYGIGQVGERLVHLVKIAEMISEEEFRSMTRAVA